MKIRPTILELLYVYRETDKINLQRCPEEYCNGAQNAAYIKASRWIVTQVLTAWHTPMPWVGVEHKTPLREWSQAGHVSDCARYKHSNKTLICNKHYYLELVILQTSLRVRVFVSLNNIPTNCIFS